jgi:2-oxoisovalerate dehydrogenase E1 component
MALPLPGRDGAKPGATVTPFRRRQAAASPGTGASLSPAPETSGPAVQDGTFRGVPVAEIIDDFRQALVSRFMDDREIALQKQSRVFFQISGAGHEALLLGLGRSLRPGHDWFFPYYRDRALMLALGLTPTDILLQSVGAATDRASGGRQMPSHFGSRHHNVVTQSSPTGSQCLPAVGCAEAGRYLNARQVPGARSHPDEITYVSLGDGATSEGEFWESLNTACTLRLPVLFLVADNGYAISVPVAEQAPGPISELVSAFPGLDVHRVDGRDYFEVRAKAPEIVAGIRSGRGPALMHATVTRPYSHSSADTQSKYRSRAELEEEAAFDPIALLERALVDGGILSLDEANAIRDDAHKIVADAAREALAAPRPDPATVREHVRELPVVADEEWSEEAARPADPAAPPVAMGEAIRLTLHEAMARDERIRVFGEDVGDAREAVLSEVEGKGGVFGTTHGLQRTFGPERCYNTPLAEANIVGRAVGQAVRGLRPVPEIQFFDYIWTAMQQIKSEAATIRWRSAGHWTCPLVLRVPIGGYLTGGAIWHSQSGESIFAHVPGLSVVMPSRASDAAGLLRTALSGEDPVLFLEHKHLLRQPYTREPLPGPGYRIPFGKGRIVRPGHDLTLITYGATVQRSLHAVSQVGAEVEVIDLRSISPWDHDLVAESVARTGRALVVHEDVLTCGFGAEIAAWIGEHCFGDLDAPVRRVGATDTHVPYEPTLERAVLPQAEGIAQAIEALLSF